MTAKVNRAFHRKFTNGTVYFIIDYIDENSVTYRGVMMTNTETYIFQEIDFKIFN